MNYMNQPAYLQKFSEVMDMNSNRQLTWSGKRGELTDKFGWTIPNMKLVNFLANESRDSNIIEVGAGNGYLAYEINKNGGNIIPIDIKEPQDTWVSIKEMSYESLNPSETDNILLSWPPASSKMGECCIEYINPTILYFIGKENSTVTGTERFHSLIDNKYSIEEEFKLPSWTSNPTVFKKCVKI